MPKPTNPQSNNTQWKVYILECADNTLYTGITTNIARRVDEHNHSNKGARYTRSRRPVRLAYQENCDSRSAASKREYSIKQLARQEKQQLINQVK